MGNGASAQKKDGTPAGGGSPRNETTEKTRDKPAAMMTPQTPNTTMKSSVAVQACVRIQKWFRQRQALLEVRRRLHWRVFESMDYTEENQFLELAYKISSALFEGTDKNNDDSETHAIAEHSRYYIERMAVSAQHLSENIDFDNIPDLTDIQPSLIKEPNGDDYTGPAIRSAVLPTQMNEVKKWLQRGQRLDLRSVVQILQQAHRILKNFDNVQEAMVIENATIVGDLHGSIKDLVYILDENGMPSPENIYVFNGDMVDRGSHGLEVMLIILSLMIALPKSVFINRGNHEDFVMNKRYNFAKEVEKKYPGEAAILCKCFNTVFKALPIALVLYSKNKSQKVFVCHGGISKGMTVAALNKIPRNTFNSILIPPFKFPLEDRSRYYWKIMLDIMWSDPQNENGEKNNLQRGGGNRFGPDVTLDFLSQNGFEYMVRSHECSESGHKTHHGGKLHTIFSCTDYHRKGSNNGAFLKMTNELALTAHTYELHIIKKAKNTMKINNEHEATLRCVRELVSEKQHMLERAFAVHDPHNTGIITLGNWYKCLIEIVDDHIPWLSFKESLVVAVEDVWSKGVLYKSSFVVDKSINGQTVKSSVEASLFEFRARLHALFCLIDSDNSGEITADELISTYYLVNSTLDNKNCTFSTIPTEKELREFMATMDVDSNNKINFEEFFHTFKVAHRNPANAKSP